MASFKVSFVLLQLDFALMGPNSVQVKVNLVCPNETVFNNFSNAFLDASHVSDVNNSTSEIDFKLMHLNLCSTLESHSFNM
jgi:hypothetical protein